MMKVYSQNGDIVSTELYVDRMCTTEWGLGEGFIFDTVLYFTAVKIDLVRQFTVAAAHSSTKKKKLFQKFKQILDCIARHILFSWVIWLLLIPPLFNAPAIY